MTALPFDVCGPLPRGVTVLEASAGTGKTYTIAALAARYVASGTPLHELLLVTFTRMATGELRERVRERLVATERGLAEGGGDAVTRMLADAPPDEVERRRARLARALADFDAATIATTHGFCQEVLGGLGTAGDVERDCRFVEDTDDLLEEVVDDLYVRRFHRHGRPQFSREEAMRIARAAIESPGAAIEPAEAPGESIAAMRVRLAERARIELEERKRRAGVMTYDDLLTRLEATLSGPGGEAAAARLRERYRVVLVDEFQDTDPVQWAILRQAFGSGTLVLIGDPKQAIYAFRGADVYAYLAAARAADVRATLDVNRRSDQALIDAYDALFRGARLGHEGIVYRTVRAAPENRGPRLAGAHAGLRLRVVRRADPTVGVTPQGYARVAPAREHIARDVAADLVRLLDSGAAVQGAPVRPGHVAVLVRTNRNAARVRDALEAAGVPAVINGAGSVFGTAAARDWLRLLEALERPSSLVRARTAALTPLLGWTAEQLAGGDEDAWEALHRRLHAWARVLRTEGVASLAETITLAEGLPGRVLARADGERTLTDLRHVAQLLHAAAVDEQLGTTALATWLRHRIENAAEETSDEQRSRRLESDEEAVQVLTIHRSKGLEFPLVYYPDLWEPTWVQDEPVPIAFHDAAGARVIDVGLDGPDFPAHRRRHLVEQRGEDLRLAYVALTRAQHQAVVWWAGSWASRNSPLGRLLFAKEDDGTVAFEGRFTPTDRAAFERFGALAAEAEGCVAVEPSELGPPETWRGAPRRAEALAAARLERPLDRLWRRTSFSDITAEAAHEPRVGSEPEEPAVDDEPTAAPLGELPAGVHVGTLVHRVLEAADFAAPDLPAELTARLAEAQARRPVDLGDERVAVAGLHAALETPLGPLAGGLRLCDVRRADRLDELAFELPLAGGDAPSGEVTLDAVADVLRAGLPAGDPLAGYADRLADPALRRGVRGFLTGTIDLVVRLGGTRFAIVDYKTNRLAPAGEPLTAWHHRPEALAAEMQRSHYALQAILYTVALHRYLRWRLPGYDPERHLAGVLYLFLRGMTGGGEPDGVFAWRPPGALVEALSEGLSEAVTSASEAR